MQLQVRSADTDCLGAPCAHADRRSGNRQVVEDRDGLPLVLFRDDWALQRAQEKHPELQFLAAAPRLKAEAAA